MRINHNISAMNAHRLLNANQTIGAKNLEKLSSGKRINRAGDDAAGMAITEKMRAQIKGLQMASRNSLDGVSLVQTAEGAMAEVHSMLQRMRELCVQAANGTSAQSDREAIQDEINQLTSEINRISNGTEYNTRNIMKGNEGPDANALVHRMSTGKPAQMAGTENLNASGLSFDLKSEQLSIFIDGEEKVVNLTGTNSTTDKDRFMELINDALGKSANAVIDKSGKIEITTGTVGGLSTIEIKGSKDALAMFRDPSTLGIKAAESPSVQLGSGSGSLFKINAGSGNGDIGNVSIKFVSGASGTTTWVGNTLTIQLSGSTYSGGSIASLIQGATSGAPDNIKMSAFTVSSTGTINITAGDLPVTYKLSGGETGTIKATGTAENASTKAMGTFYFDDVPEVGATIQIGTEVIEFFDSSKAPYIGSNRPIDIAGKETAEEIVDEIVKKFATGIDGVVLSEDPKFDTTSGASIGKSTNSRIIIEAKDPGFDGNLIYLEGTLDEFTTNLQVGSNTGQGFRLTIGDIRAQNLKISADDPTRNPGVKGASYVATGATVTDGISSSMVEYAIDVTTESKASAAITVYNNAIVQVARERSILGATQNRLEHTIANLDNTAENLTAAMSRIEDTDMAKEMSEFQKISVLQQAGVSMLAQANQLPQSVLKLLG